MTDMPDDLPSPDEFRRKMAHVDREFADARRYLSALCAEDNQALGALMVEIHRSGRAMNVLAATAVLALDFAHLSADRLGGNVQKWLDESAMAQDTAETERDQTELGGEDNLRGPAAQAGMQAGAGTLSGCSVRGRRICQGLGVSGVVIDSTHGSRVEPQWVATIGTAPGEWAVVRHA
jgi:hypothetical protein